MPSNLCLCNSFSSAPLSPLPPLHASLRSPSNSPTHPVLTQKHCMMMDCRWSAPAPQAHTAYSVFCSSSYLCYLLCIGRLVWVVLLTPSASAQCMSLPSSQTCKVCMQGTCRPGIDLTFCTCCQSNMTDSKRTRSIHARGNPKAFKLYMKQVDHRFAAGDVQDSPNERILAHTHCVRFIQSKSIIGCSISFLVSCWTAIGRDSS